MDGWGNGLRKGWWWVRMIMIYDRTFFCCTLVASSSFAFISTIFCSSEAFFSASFFNFSNNFWFIARTSFRCFFASAFVLGGKLCGTKGSKRRKPAIQLRLKGKTKHGGRGKRRRRGRRMEREGEGRGDRKEGGRNEMSGENRPSNSDNTSDTEIQRQGKQMRTDRHTSRRCTDSHISCPPASASRTFFVTIQSGRRRRWTLGSCFPSARGGKENNREEKRRQVIPVSVVVGPLAASIFHLEMKREKIRMKSEKGSLQERKKREEERSKKRLWMRMRRMRKRGKMNEKEIERKQKLREKGRKREKRSGWKGWWWGR